MILLSILFLCMSSPAIAGALVLWNERRADVRAAIEELTR